MAECPPEALRDATLAAGARLVLVALWHRAGREKRFVWPSRDTLAADCGMAPRTLRKHLAALKSRRWITEHVGDETSGNPGWYLCDPPGTPQALGVEAPIGTHDRSNGASQTCHVERHEHATLWHERAGRRPERAALAAVAGTNVPRERHERAASTSIGTNQEPMVVVKAREGGNEPPPPPARRGLPAVGWRSDFAFAWRQHFDADARGCIVHNPTTGSHRLVELQRMLDEHGPQTVTAVLLHAGERVVRWHETREQHGLPPRMFAATFREDRPQAFEALLDAWQADRGRKRVSGKTAAAPADLDGVPLTDEEQRVWMRAMGEDPEGAVRREREAQEARDLVAGSLGSMLGGGL